MPTSPKHAVRLAAPSASAPLSKVRKQFNSLVKRLDAERARLALWREEVPKIQALADSKFAPLMRTFNGHRHEVVVLLDQVWSDKAITKTERKKLSDIITANADELLRDGTDDEVLQAIYDRHSGGDYALEQAAETAAMLEMLGEATGIELDDDVDLGSPQAIFEALQKKLEEEAIAQEEKQRARPAKPSAREVRQQAEETKLKQSVRDIFRKLASALHPDRETDPAEHARKTGLMQRANAAYAANDLLGLLELQLAVEQIDQAGLDNLGEDRIRQYNRILEDQLYSVKNEISAMESALAWQMQWDSGKRPTPEKLRQLLDADIVALKANIDHIVADIAIFRDTKKLKAWLKSYRIPDPDDDMPWF